MMQRIATTLLIGSLFVLPVFAGAAESSDSVEEIAIELAHTSQQHATLAQHFRAMAEEARADAQRHETMARAYNAGKFIQRLKMSRHCEGLSQKYNAMAEEYEALAKLHEEEAKQ